MALGVTRHDWRARGPLDACHQLPPHQQHSNTSGQGQNWIQVGCSMLERMNGLLPRGRCFAGTHCYTWRSAQPFGHGAMVIHMLQRKHDSCKHNHRWMPCKGCQNLHHATNNYREGPEHPLPGVHRKASHTCCHHRRLAARYTTLVMMCRL